MTKILSANDVKALLNISDTINTLEIVFAEFEKGTTQTPMRTPIDIERSRGLVLFMPSYVGGVNALGTKAVSVFKDNPEKYNKSTISGTITLIDDENGDTLAIIEAGYLTAMRTGGVAGLATKHLSKENSKVHTLFGLGGMAAAHAFAVQAVRPIEKLNLFSLDPIEKKIAFKEELEKLIDCEIIISDDAEASSKEADVISLITSSPKPVTKHEWLTKGVHINALGAHTPETREVDSEIIINSVCTCDSISACENEAGEFIIPVNEGVWSWDKMNGTLGEVINKKVSGRTNDEEITFFKSVGLGIQDISVAKHVYDMSIEKNIGLNFDFE